MIERPSPNHGPRTAGARIDMLILHYTGMTSCAAALDRLCDAATEVSAHYLVGEDGTTYALVPECRRAWHAGAGSWAGDRDVNGRSIGIELANPGHDLGYVPFPPAQMAALEALAKRILGRHPIVPAHVLGHSDVAPARKRDPGELFDWARLAAAGIGLWPGGAGAPAPGPVFGPADRHDWVAETQASLARFGYAVATTGVMDAATTQVVTAFQRHFRPTRIDGRLDAQTRRRVADLLVLAG